MDEETCASQAWSRGFTHGGSRLAPLASAPARERSLSGSVLRAVPPCWQRVRVSGVGTAILPLSRTAASMARRRIFDAVQVGGWHATTLPSGPECDAAEPGTPSILYGQDRFGVNQDSLP